MKTNQIFVIFVIFIGSILFSACQKLEDVGAFQEETQTYNFTNFTRLQMGSAFKIYVQKGSTFSINVRGDRRNLDDLRIRVENDILKADYYPNFNKSRQYTTEFTIIMPALDGVDFSGASISDIGGFENSKLTEIKLSGASISTLNLQTQQVTIEITGASRLALMGASPKMTAEISGASLLESFNFASELAQLKVSGASNAKIKVSKELNAEASGASHIRYIGNPIVVTNKISGASSISKE